MKEDEIPVAEHFFSCDIICKERRYKAMKNTVCVIGGDLRQIRLSTLLEQEGFSVCSIGLSEDDYDFGVLKEADIVILPMPVSFDDVYINAPFSKNQIRTKQRV